MTKIVGSITRGQGHELLNQIENAAKAENLNPEELASKLIRENFFGNKISELAKRRKKKSISIKDSFCVGDIFYHPTENDPALDFSVETYDQLIQPNLKKIIFITSADKLSKYYLQRNTNDTTIQIEAGRPGFMTEDYFLLIIYLSIFKPELAIQILGFTLAVTEEYLFHVRVKGEKTALCLKYSHTGKWWLRAVDFDSARRERHTIFVF